MTSQNKSYRDNHVLKSIKIRKNNNSVKSKIYFSSIHKQINLVQLANGFKKEKLTSRFFLESSFC